MSWKKLQIPAVLLLGGFMGFGMASYRNFMSDRLQAAQEQARKKARAASSRRQGPSRGAPWFPRRTRRRSRARSAAPSANRPPIGRRWPRAPKGAPNVLYIVLDDVGYAALGCYGSPVCKTPHMDKLAKNGVRYNNFHTTALCSPEPIVRS